MICLNLLIIDVFANNLLSSFIFISTAIHANTIAHKRITYFYRNEEENCSVSWSPKCR